MMTDYELWLFGFVYPAAVVAAVMVALALGGLSNTAIAALAGVFMVAGSAVVVAV